MIKMDEEFIAIYCIVRDEIHAALGHDVEIELIMPPGCRSNKQRGSKRISTGINLYLFEGGHSDEEDNI